MTLTVGEAAREVLQTAFRLAPWPTEPGLRRIGNPGRDSPVLVTGNYDLTVRRLTRALAGVDAWLLVAPSGGINVWCAAAGGHLGTPQVVTALKTSGIAERVDHRQVILPQLAATGVLALEVFRRARWKVRFGPVRAEDLPAYLEGGVKTDAMRRVAFPLGDRLQMAVQWAAPTTILLGGICLLLEPAWLLPLSALIAAMSAAVFTLYDRMGTHRRVTLAAAGAAFALAITAVAGGGAGALAAAALCPVLLTAVLTFDYAGSTPLEGGSHFEEKRFELTFAPERCEGVFRCVEVCPEACFEKREESRKVELAHEERCIRCGACIVQCPKDALFFETEDGGRIEPDHIRRFKLNLMGARKVDGGRERGAA
jgi:NAD-dependent dihydropyrimidine dehydrogenase PreA subunit